MRISHATGSILIALLSVPALAARRDVDGVGARVEQELEPVSGL